MGALDATGSLGTDELMVAEAALASAERTADAVENAAELNDDPAMAGVLVGARVQAETTVGRLHWLKRRIRGRVRKA
jgi:hypothetical protein